LGNVVFFKLLRLALKFRNFSYNGDFYEQVFGLAMGNPLSPVISNIFMECMERYLLKDLINDITWFLYVDDTFVIMDSETDIQEFLDTINSYVDSIKFTCEEERGGQLAFLDVLILRDNLNGFKTKVYRKPTHVDNYLHAFSDAEMTVKIGVIAGMFLRAYRICSPEFLDEEIKYIREVFNKLGYSEFMINKGLFRGRKTFFCGEKSEPINNKFENVLVIPRCEVRDLNLIPSDVKVIFKKGVCIGDLVRSKNNTSRIESTGIYAIPCNGCEGVYIGETDDMSRRMREHNSAIKDKDIFSSLFVHEQKSLGHSVEVDKGEIFVKINHVVNRKNIESFVIASSNNFNLKSGSERLDLVDLNFIKYSDLCRSGLCELDKLKERWKIGV
jgi:hypothetical protein